MPSPAILTRDLVKIYHPGRKDEVCALDRLSLEVPRGEIFGLLGPNGAGKSTLLKILTTILPQSAGEASIMGYDTATRPLQVRRNICAVLQENAVELFLSVEDNFRTYGRFHGLSRAEIAERSRRVIDLFGLEGDRHHKVIDLSGGFKRRVQVAKVFMVDAPVVFLDEATTGMDPINKRATLEAVAAEASRGRTIFLTTHILDEAEELCHRMMFIDKGRMLMEGDLYAFKSLAQKFVEVSVTFLALGAELRARIERLPARERTFIGNTVLLRLESGGQSAHDLIGLLSQWGEITAFEVHGATLEDVFVQLLGAQGASA